MQAAVNPILALIDMACGTRDQHNVRVAYECIANVWPSSKDIPEKVRDMIRRAVAEMTNKAIAPSCVPPEFWDRLSFENIMRLMVCADDDYLRVTAQPMILEKQNEMLYEALQLILDHTDNFSHDKCYDDVKRLLANYKGDLAQTRSPLYLLETLGHIAHKLIDSRFPLLKAFTGGLRLEPLAFFANTDLFKAVMHETKTTPRSADETLKAITALRDHPNISTITETEVFHGLMAHTHADCVMALSALYSAENKRKAGDLESAKKRRR